MKEVKIEVPEGYEIDKENSTFECIKFKPKELTYGDIARKLFSNKEGYNICINGKIVRVQLDNYNSHCPNNALTRKQCERLLAINKLMNVAYYFNEIVNKDIYCSKRQYLLSITVEGKIEILEDEYPLLKDGIVSFKTKESAKKAIKILGEETVKLAISL